jgi:hypothetical protein
MKVHEKAKLYDELMKDIEGFVREVERHHQEVDVAENDPLLGETETSTKNSRLVGKYQGMNFGLLMKVKMFRGTLDWYKKQK